MKNKITPRAIIILIALITITIIIAGGIYFWQVKNSTQNTTSDASIENTSTNDSDESEDQTDVTDTRPSDSNSSSATSGEQLDSSYSNPKIGLSFNYPNDWILIDEKEQKIGAKTQLRLKLASKDNDEAILLISTPLIETGYIGFETEPGFNKTLPGLTLGSSSLLRNNETGVLMARDVYYQDPDDFFTSLEFIYIAPSHTFDAFLTDYHFIRNSVKFK